MALFDRTQPSHTQHTSVCDTRTRNHGWSTITLAGMRRGYEPCDRLARWSPLGPYNQPESALMQHQMPPRTQRRYRPSLLGLAGTHRLSQGEHGAGQIKVDCFLSQHSQALQYVGCCCVSSCFGQIVVNHDWRNLCGLSHPSVRPKPSLYVENPLAVARKESVGPISQ